MSKDAVPVVALDAVPMFGFDFVPSPPASAAARPVPVVALDRLPNITLSEQVGNHFGVFVQRIFEQRDADTEEQARRVQELGTTLLESMSVIEGLKNNAANEIGCMKSQIQALEDRSNQLVQENFDLLARLAVLEAFADKVRLTFSSI
jgi:hypothetical protein